MNCIEATKVMVFQITEVLEAIDAEHYAKPLDVFQGSTLGQHFRHILDFYRCLLKGLEGHTIDYERRERDPLVEQDPAYAVRAFLDIQGAIGDVDVEASVDVRADFSLRQEDSRPMVRSSLGRELMFAYDHAVHHLAIIKIGLRVALPQLALREELGVAPSTIKFRNTVGG